MSFHKYLFIEVQVQQRRKLSSFHLSLFPPLYSQFVLQTSYHLGGLLEEPLLPDDELLLPDDDEEGV